MNILKLHLIFILSAIYLAAPAYGMVNPIASDADLWILPDKKAYDAKKSESECGDFFLSNASSGHFVPAHLKKLLQKTNRIVLTFDDGPHPNATPHILKTLRKYNLHAVFFILGLQAEKHPDLVKMIYDEGHVIGNHTYSHKKLTDLSEDQMRTEITKTGNLIASITGEKPKLLRPPYGIGADNKLLQKIAAEEDLKFFLWTVDSKDWKSKNEKAILTSVERQLGIGIGNRTGGAVLLHDIYPTTANALELIVKSAASSGYIFIDPFEMPMTNEELFASRRESKYRSFDPELSGNSLLVALLTKEKKDLKVLDVIRAHKHGNLMLFLALTK